MRQILLLLCTIRAKDIIFYLPVRVFPRVASVFFHIKKTHQFAIGQMTPSQIWRHHRGSEFLLPRKFGFQRHRRAVKSAIKAYKKRDLPRGYYKNSKKKYNVTRARTGFFILQRPMTK